MDSLNSSDNQLAVDSLLNLEQLVRSHLSKLDDLKGELSKLKEMLDDLLLNDPNYREANEQAKVAAKAKKQAKEAILSLSGNLHIAQKHKDISQEIRQLKSSLSNHLQQYQRLSQSNQIEDESGQTRQIVYTAKLVKVSAKNGL
ncbi:hypothetical protein HY333_01260 [Candidatus Collierbacteria bacterium]|nr:hypothetical protein [Candidatus Collierbacteria bacterium]